MKLKMLPQLRQGPHPGQEHGRQSGIPSQEEGLLKMLWLSVILFFGLTKLYKSSRLTFPKNTAWCERPVIRPTLLVVLKQKGQEEWRLDQEFSQHQYYCLGVDPSWLYGAGSCISGYFTAPLTFGQEMPVANPTPILTNKNASRYGLGAGQIHPQGRPTGLNP